MSRKLFLFFLFFFKAIITQPAAYVHAQMCIHPCHHTSINSVVFNPVLLKGLLPENRQPPRPTRCERLSSTPVLSVWPLENNLNIFLRQGLSLFLQAGLSVKCVCLRCFVTELLFQPPLQVPPCSNPQSWHIKKTTGTEKTRIRL